MPVPRDHRIRTAWSVIMSQVLNSSMNQPAATRAVAIPSKQTWLPTPPGVSAVRQQLAYLLAEPGWC